MLMWRKSSCNTKVYLRKKFRPKLSPQNNKNTRYARQKRSRVIILSRIMMWCCKLNVEPVNFIMYATRFVSSPLRTFLINGAMAGEFERVQGLFSGEIMRNLLIFMPKISLKFAKWEKKSHTKMKIWQKILLKFLAENSLSHQFWLNEWFSLMILWARIIPACRSCFFSCSSKFEFFLVNGVIFILFLSVFNGKCAGDAVCKPLLI